MVEYSVPSYQLPNIRISLCSLMSLFKWLSDLDATDTHDILWCHEFSVGKISYATFMMHKMYDRLSNSNDFFLKKYQMNSTLFTLHL